MMQANISEEQAVVEWLLAAQEPWTRFRTYLDLLQRPEEGEVAQVRKEMVAHEQVQELIATAESWPGYALKRHNDAKHPIYALSTLADFGLRHDDPGLRPAIDKVMSHQSAEGPFQTQIRLYKRFGGMDGEYWTWMACDAPTLTYTLLSLGLEDDPRVKRAVDHLLGSVQDNGWRCTVAPELGSFHGPGNPQNPCPIANLNALKVLSLLPEQRSSTAAKNGSEILLMHWAREYEKKLFLFGAGAKFRKLKYPYVWYDILHVADVLSRFPFVHDDPRFQEMVETITQQADEDGRYTAASMYRAWKGFSFADKKQPSPWLTFLVLRMQKRLAGNQ